MSIQIIGFYLKYNRNIYISNLCCLYFDECFRFYDSNTLIIN